MEGLGNFEQRRRQEDFQKELSTKLGRRPDDLPDGLLAAGSVHIIDEFSGSTTNLFLGINRQGPEAFVTVRSVDGRREVVDTTFREYEPGQAAPVDLSPIPPEASRRANSDYDLGVE